jgi:hypothetical protein
MANRINLLFVVIALAVVGCESPEPAESTTTDSAVDSVTEVADTSDSTACPATMPTIGSDCSFVGDDKSFSTTPVCKYHDPTAPSSDAKCKWFLACNGGKVASAGVETIAVGCPETPPVDGTSCTCGGHGYGESSGGSCTYPCDGGTFVARCDLGGMLSPSAPGSVKWKVTSCGASDAGGD